MTIYVRSRRRSGSANRWMDPPVTDSGPTIQPGQETAHIVMDDMCYLEI
jgi:hypothetical protein